MRIRSLTFIVNDIAKSKAFYEKLGFKVLSGDIDRVVLETDNDDQNLVLLKESKSRKLAGHSIGAFYKENVPGFFQKCKIMGVAFERDLTDSDNGKAFAFRDPDGNGLEIFEKTKVATEEKEDKPAGKDLPQEEQISQKEEEIQEAPETEEIEEEMVDDSPFKKYGDFQPYIEDKVN